MKRLYASREIAASPDFVFRTVSDVRNFQNAVSHIIHVEFLSDQHCGVGTRFRETRLVNGREQTVEIEVAELVDNKRVRMISDAGGTIWDSLFTVSVNSPTITLGMTMEIQPYKMVAKLITPLISGLVLKGVEADMDAVKVYCESKCP